MLGPLVSLPGSTRFAVAGAKMLGRTDGSQQIVVTLILKPANDIAYETVVAHALTAPAARPEMTRAEFAQKYGAPAAAVEAILSFANESNLLIERNDPTRRAIEVSGTVAQMEAAFGVNLYDYEHGSGKYRGRVGPIQIPSELLEYVEAILGLDNRPVAKPRIVSRLAQTQYYPQEIAALYDFPDADGTGQVVGIVELGGAYDDGDLQQYFVAAGTPMPIVRTVSVAPAVPSAYGQDPNSDGEVMLDIEVVVPKATIVVYFAANTDDGFYNAVSQAVHDTVNKPSVISISWGDPEKRWSEQAANAWHSLGKAAALLNVSIFAASGDHGSSDQEPTDGDYDKQRHADFPGTVPHIVSCGGTRLDSNGGSIAGEVAWNDGDGCATGGGVSIYFNVPPWQHGLLAEPGTQLKMRGVPDVAGNADPATGFRVRANGNDLVSGGTSAVAPLWAALTARINQLVGRHVGLITPSLYAKAAVLRDITSGANGCYGAPAYQAKQNWDACTGLGSPNGKSILALFQKLPAKAAPVGAPAPVHTS
jgi:kumamolisin